MFPQYIVLILYACLLSAHLVINVNLGDNIIGVGVYIYLWIIFKSA